jgi:hypothetical protein
VAKKNLNCPPQRRIFAATRSLPSAGRLGAFARIIPFLEIKTLIFFLAKAQRRKEKIRPKQECCGGVRQDFCDFPALRDKLFC